MQWENSRVGLLVMARLRPMTLGFFVLCLLAFFPHWAAAATISDESVATSSQVLVVYNSNYTTDEDSDGLQDSQEIAEYYQQARQIPAANVFAVSASTTEVITRENYNSSIKPQLESYLTTSGLRDQIKYIVLVKGVPLKISSTTYPYCDVYGSTDCSSVDAAVCLLYQSYNTAWLLDNPYYNADGQLGLRYRFKTNFFSKSGGPTLRYLVTRLDAYTLSQAKAMIDRAIAADQSGTAYAILDGAQKAYDRLSSADTNWKLLQRNALPEPWTDTTDHITSAPGSVIAYVGHGVHAGLSSDYFSTTLSGLTWANGAVASTYESFNAWNFVAANARTTSQQGTIADFIAVGGTGGVGNVYEPWTPYIANESIFLSLYAAGYTWADAAYQSLPAIDFVNVVVGDPLMRINTANYSAPTNFAASLSGSSVALSWQNPSTDFNGVAIIRKSNEFTSTSSPAGLLDGTVVYQGTGTSFTDSDITLGNRYLYSIFAFNTDRNFSLATSSAQVFVDAGLQLSFVNQPLTLAEGGSAQNFTVSLSRQPSANVSVVFSSLGVFSYDHQTLSFTSSNWQTPQTVAVRALDDSIYRGDRVVEISIAVSSSDANYDNLTAPNFSATIIENDQPGLVFSTSSLQLSELGEASRYYLHLATQPLYSVEIVPQYDSGQITVSPSSLTFTTSNWDVYQGLNAQAINDHLIEGSTTSTINYSVSSSDAAYGETSFPGTAITITEENQVIISAPPSFINSQTGFTLAVSGSLEAYRYKLDGGAYSVSHPLSDSIVLSGLAPGFHTLQLIGQDAVGTWQAAATVYSWLTTASGVAASMTDNVTNFDIATSSSLLNLTDSATTTININLTSSVTNNRLDLTALVATTTTSTQAQISSAWQFTRNWDGNSITVNFPANTTIYGGSEWDGLLTLPEVKASSSVTPVADSGKTIAERDLAIEVGVTDRPLTFSRGVRIIFPGQAGRDIGFVSSGSFSKITNGCSEDSQTAGDALAAGSDCKIDSGSDLIVWTKHFSTFITYIQATVSGGGSSSGGGGGGGGGGGSSSLVIPNASGATSAPGLPVVTLLGVNANKKQAYLQITVDQAPEALMVSGSMDFVNAAWQPYHQVIVWPYNTTAEVIVYLKVKNSLGASPTATISFTPAAAANLSSSFLAEGDLFRTKNNSALYYYDQSGQRRLFSNEVTFWTWFSGRWSDQTVKTISEEQMLSIPLGKNLTARPGINLLRFDNSQRIYAVVNEGQICEVVNPAIYGANWSKRVIIIQSSFENDYFSLGRCVTTAEQLFPNATLMHSGSDYYLLQDGLKRRLSASGWAANYLIPAAAVNASTDNYPSGIEISEPEAKLYGLVRVNLSYSKTVGK